jgi:hypothetical protein
MVRHQVVLWPSYSVTCDDDGEPEYTRMESVFEVVSHHDMPPEEDWAE